MKNSVFPFIIILSIISSCSTEVDLTADYLPTTIVYSLLDPVQDTQWVKINKTFIGDGNNLDYATIRDSSEYDFSDFAAVVEELDANENVVNTFALDSMTIHNKEISGIFYSPHQTVYFFENNGGLNEEHEYRLKIDFENKNDVSAKTDIVKVDEIVMENPMQNSGASLLLAQSVGTEGFTFKTHTVRFVPIENAPFYEITVRFYYNELVWADANHTILVSETMKSLNYYVGSFDQTNVNSSGKINADISGESFFAYLGNNIVADPLITREIGIYDLDAEPEAGTHCYDVIIHAGGEELNTYFQVHSPVTGIVQERPFYTNVNGGLGLFSSRATHDVTDIFLVNEIGNPNEGPERAFVNSVYTQDLNFCNPNPSSDYSCED
ncbi:MAG: hypothetical protein SH856_02530 [Flavobacteriales bacterium]|nr:hypothetical protein [Flavobacteriales bacterium]